MTTGRENRDVVIEINSDNQRHVFTVDRARASVSGLLREVIGVADYKEKDIQRIKLRIHNHNAPITPVVQYLLHAGGSARSDHHADVWEAGWLQTIENRYLLDTLVVAGQFKIGRICTLIYGYMNQEAARMDDSDFREKFGIRENERVRNLSEVDRGVLCVPI